MIFIAQSDQTSDEDGTGAVIMVAVVPLSNVDRVSAVTQRTISTSGNDLRNRIQVPVVNTGRASKNRCGCLMR